MPALLNMMCSAPNRSVVNSTSAATCSGCATSVSLNAASLPSSSTACLPRASSMSATTTLAPSATSRAAVPNPMPEDPPVTMATLPASSSGIAHSHSSIRSVGRRSSVGSVVGWLALGVDAHAAERRALDLPPFGRPNVFLRIVAEATQHEGAHVDDVVHRPDAGGGVGTGDLDLRG